MPFEIPRLDTVPEEHDDDLAGAAASSPPDPSTVLARRDAAVARLCAARAVLEDEIAEVRTSELFSETGWSVMHVLAHLGADGGGHFAPVFDIVRGARELEPYRSRDDKFQDSKKAALEALDADIAFAEGLARDELLKHARKGSRPHYVIGFIEETADHVEGHLGQLRAIKAKLHELRQHRQASAAG